MFEIWMNRSVGRWESHRRYLYGSGGGVDNLITRFEVDTKDDGWIVEWVSDEHEGSMDLWIEGEWLHRSCGYYSQKPSTSRLEKIDQDTIVFWSEYGGMKFREEIRFIQSDNYRLRQTIGYNDKGELTICGQYFEERL